MPVQLYVWVCVYCSIEWRNVHWQQTNLDTESKLLLYSAIYDPNIGEYAEQLRQPSPLLQKYCTVSRSNNMYPGLVASLNRLTHQQTICDDNFGVPSLVSAYSKQTWTLIMVRGIC